MLCSRSSFYSLNYHGGAMAVIHKLCRIAQSSRAYKTEIIKFWCISRSRWLSTNRPNLHFSYGPFYKRRLLPNHVVVNWTSLFWDKHLSEWCSSLECLQLLLSSIIMILGVVIVVCVVFVVVVTKPCCFFLRCYETSVCVGCLFQYFTPAKSWSYEHC